MPKVPAYTLLWSSAHQAYELHQYSSLVAHSMKSESPAWFVWLADVPSFAFHGQRGSYTAHKETKQRGDAYWHAYRRSGGKLTKKYLGKTADLTLARLEHVASQLCSEGEAAVPTMRERPSTPVHREAQRHVATAHVRLDTAPHATPSIQRDPLLATKLHVPRLRAQLVQRSRLTERLQHGVEGTLTLISAPAGYGKSVLLAQWLAESDLSVAWLSLEPEDNEPTRFLSYVIGALQTLDSRLGTTALSLLHTGQPLPLETVLTILSNDLVSQALGDFVLVLDDYHVITSESIHRALIFLLDHLPPQLHLIIATRADPPLPLVRLRARGQLTELRASDLRFAREEVRTFLHTVMGLALPPEAIATLESRTEGWVAGLQLAALSLRGRADISGFLAAFSGSHRFVLDYLSEEVFSRQDGAVQAFLLQTAILEHLSGSLCDAVTGQKGSQVMLEALEQANLFVVALDDERHWYRYHHLFAEVLRGRIMQVQRELVPELHRRASTWYEQHALLTEAVQHALAARDVEHAARLIEQCALSLMMSQGQVLTVLGWLNMLPDAPVYTRPFLCLYQALALFMTRQVEQGEAYLAKAKNFLQADAFPEQVHTIQGYIAVIRSNVARITGDLMQTAAFADQALELLPEAEANWRMAAGVYRAHANLESSGDVTVESEWQIRALIAPARASGFLSSHLRSLTTLARLHVLQGQLYKAALTYQEAGQVAVRPEVLQALSGSPAYYFGFGDLLRERNNLEEAERLLSQGMELVGGALTVFAEDVWLGYLALARLKLARGEYSQALSILDAFTQLAHERHYVPHLLACGAAMRAQVELAQGHFAAVDWVNTSDLSAYDHNPSYLRELEYLTLARVRIAQGREERAGPFLQEILHLLDRLRQSAQANARLGSVLEILILQALALEVYGERSEALSRLERVLALAEPQRYVRLFADEGIAMARLIAHLLATRHGGSRYCKTLLTACQAQGQMHAAGARANKVQLKAVQPLVDPLSEREMEVLRLLALGASNAEIAERLVVATSTAKYHIKNILAKLAAVNRTQAVARARELGLL
jgi:ATP/maltotriose-dependent transcriptional regulator MalT